MIKNVNVPASVLHEKDGKTYRIAGKILSLNESDNTCTMSFRKGENSVIKHNIPLDRVAVNEGIMDMLKKAGEWAKNKVGKVIDFVCKKVGRFIVAIIDGVKVELQGLVANAFERTKSSKAINVFPSKTQVEAAAQSGMNIEVDTDPDAIASQAMDEEEDWAQVRRFWERLRDEFIGTLDNPAPEDRTIEEAIRNVYTKYYPRNVLYEANGIKYQNHRVLNEAGMTPEEIAQKEGTKKIISLRSYKYPNVDRATLIETLKSSIQSQIEGNILYPDSTYYKTINQFRETAKKEAESRAYMKDLPDGKSKKVYRAIGSDREIDWDVYAEQRASEDNWFNTKFIKIGNRRVEVPEDFRWTDARIFDPKTKKFFANYDIKMDGGELSFAPNQKWLGQRKIERARMSPICIWGAPGIGKTTILKTAAKIYADSYRQASGGAVDKHLSFITLSGGHLTQDDVFMILPREKEIGNTGTGAVKLPISLNTPNSILPIYRIPTPEQDPDPGHPLWTMIDNLYNGGSWLDVQAKDYTGAKRDPETGEVLLDPETSKPIPSGYSFDAVLKDSRSNVSDDAAAGMDFDDIFAAIPEISAQDIEESAFYGYGNALNEATSSKSAPAYYSDSSKCPFRTDYPDIWAAVQQEYIKKMATMPPGTSSWAPALSNIMALGFKAAWERFQEQYSGVEPNKLFKQFWSKYFVSSDDKKNYSISSHLGTIAADGSKKTGFNASPGPNGEPSSGRAFIENATGELEGIAVGGSASPAPAPQAPVQSQSEPAQAPEPEEEPVVAPEPAYDDPAEEPQAPKAPARQEAEESRETVLGRKYIEDKYNVNTITVNDGGILFIDEYTRMDTHVKSTIMTLFSDQEISGYHLASKWAIVAAANRVAELNDTNQKKYEDEVAFTDRVTQVNFVPTKEEFIEYASETIKDKNGRDTGVQRLPNDLLEMIEFFDDGAWYNCLEFGSFEYLFNKMESSEIDRYKPWIAAMKAGNNSMITKGAFAGNKGYGAKGTLDQLFDPETKKIRASKHQMDLDLPDTFSYQDMIELVTKNPDVVTGGGAKSATSRTWEAIGMEYYQKLYEIGVDDSIRAFKPNTESIDLIPPRAFTNINPEDNNLGMSPAKYEQYMLHKYLDGTPVEDNYVKMWDIMQKDIYRKKGGRLEGDVDISVIQEFEALKPWSLKYKDDDGNYTYLTPKHIKQQCAKLWLVYSLIPERVGVQNLSSYEARDFYQNYSMFTKQSMDAFVRTGGLGMKESLNINDLGYFFDPSGVFQNYTGLNFFAQYPHLMWKSQGNKLNEYFAQLLNKLFPSFTTDVDEAIDMYMRGLNAWKRTNKPSAPATPANNKPADYRNAAFDDFASTGQSNTDDEDNYNPSFTGGKVQVEENGKTKMSPRPGAVQDVIDSQINSNTAGEVSADDFWIPEYNEDDFNRFIDFCAVPFNFIFCTNPSAATAFIEKSDEEKESAGEENKPHFEQSSTEQKLDAAIFLAPEDGGCATLNKEAMYADVAIDNPWPYLVSSDICRQLIEAKIAEIPGLVVNKHAEADNAKNGANVAAARYIFAIVNFANMVYLFKNNSMFFIKCIRSIVEIARTSSFTGKPAFDNIAMVFSDDSEGILLKKYRNGDLRKAFKNCNNCFDPINFMIYYATSVADLCGKTFADKSAANQELIDLWAQDYQATNKTAYNSYIKSTGFDPANPVQAQPAAQTPADDEDENF